MFNTITANDQISHATWTGDSSQFPLCEELFTYDKNLNITRRQIRVNNVLESETHQQQQHGRVVSREHEGWRHSTHRINPDTGKGEDGRFVRVVNAHNITWKYDVNGRLVQKLVDKGGYRPLEWRYKWDARSQLTGLETPEGERWEYKYDPFGRRISKRCTSRDKRGMDFHWNGDQLTAEIPVGADGKPEDENAIRWIYEPGDFTPFARYEKGQLHYAVTDTTGRVQELLTEEGLIVWKGKQQLWGREEGISKEDAPTCRLRFPGQYEDVESGLYYNRFRYYDCDTGQYLCADPMGLRGGDCLYGYVFNPLKIIDPLGLTGDDTVRVRHHTSTEGIDGISKDGSINPARGNPVGVHVEVEPFGDPKTAGAETGAWKNGSYVEFDASKDSLTKTNVGPRNTAVIPTDDPLPLNDKNPIYKKDSFWSRIMSFIKGCDS
ncbi:RHS repeat domain-containing protein [Escherichia coli]|nr:RHS repeat-associated core domain-containing protein [Escherichia coli]MCS1920228.1 hypothetical protein [Escherichia coli]MDF9330521.1 hypothetical protein [Escherichia coli]MDM8799189.1 RHS repeat-associated core domain-containing protein [Escherichia coli]